MSLNPHYAGAQDFSAVIDLNFGSSLLAPVLGPVHQHEDFMYA